MGKNCQVPDPGKIVADSFADYLRRHSEIKLKHKSHTLYFTTDDPKKFSHLSRRFLGKPAEDVKRINLV